MKRTDTADCIKVMQAYVEGKQIQYAESEMENWTDIESPDWDWDVYDYRIKPESKYRPFKNVEECWQEMQKHQPFGWIKDKEDGHYAMVTTVDAFYDDKNYIKISGDHNWSFAETMNVYTFADGTPFGINIEEE